MNKKLNTVLFILVSTIVNVVVLLLLIAMLIALSTLIIAKVFNAADNGNVIVVTYTLCFVVAMVGNMILSAKVSSWVISHYHLEDKLESSLLKKGGKGSNKNTSTEQKEEKKKTRLPDSVLINDEDTWGQDN